MRTMNRGWVLAIALVGAGACAHETGIEQIRDLEVPATAAPPGWGEVRVSIAPFDDDRPQQAWVTKRNRVRIEHPEHAHAFGGDGVIRVGDLREEYPALLAQALPRGAHVSLGTEAADEFVIRGRLIQSTLSSVGRPILAVPGLLGVPVIRHDVDFRVRVELHRDGALEPIWHETYAFVATRREGLYYGDDGARTLARAALRDSVRRAAADVTAVIAAASRGSSEEPVEDT